MEVNRKTAAGAGSGPVGVTISRKEAILMKMTRVYSRVVTWCGVLALYHSPYLYAAESPTPAEESGERPAVKLRPKLPIHLRMDFLVDRGKLLMIPRKSLIIVPKPFENKLYKAGGLEGQLVRLSEFIAANGLWFMTYPVTFEQMMGSAKISQEELERLRAYNKVVLAIHDGQPCGVSPVALEPEEELERKVE